jgi:hypothetical protein
VRELRLSESTTLPVKATPLTRLFYRQEFGSSIDSDYLRAMSGFAQMASKAGDGFDENTPPLVLLAALGGATFDIDVMQQIIWAMGKTAALPAQWPSFQTWLGTLDDVDFFDEETLTVAFEVAADGLFRSAGRPAPAGKRKK